MALTKLDELVERRRTKKKKIAEAMAALQQDAAKHRDAEERAELAVLIEAGRELKTAGLLDWSSTERIGLYQTGKSATERQRHTYAELGQRVIEAAEAEKEKRKEQFSIIYPSRPSNLTLVGLKEAGFRWDGMSWRGRAELEVVVKLAGAGRGKVYRKTADGSVEELGDSPAFEEAAQ